MLRKILLIFILHLSNYLCCQSFYLCTSDSKIIYSDLKTCTSYSLCNLAPMVLYDIAVTPNNTLYVTDNQRIFRVDTHDCSYTAITDSLFIGQMFGEINSLVAANDSILIAAATDSKLYKISTNNGATTFIGYLTQFINGFPSSYGPDGDLTFYNGHFYLSSRGPIFNSGLLEIDLDANYTHITYLNKIGDIVVADNYGIYGLAAISDGTCKKDHLKLIAFGGKSAYLLDPSDASVQLYCKQVADNTINGAASITESSTQVIDTEIELPNVFTPNGDHINDFFTPTKAEYVVENEITVYDRWGKIVYHSNEKTFGWDGLNLQKENSSEGTYFYICLTKNSCDETITHQGFVTLLR